MRFTSSLLLAASTFTASVVSLKQDVAPRVPGAYIVEYAQNDNTDAFYSRLGQAGHAVSHRLDLKYNLFKGVSFQLKNVTDEKQAVQKIQAMPEVKHIWPVRAYSLPDDEVTWTGNEKVTPEAAGVQKRQSDTADTFSPHVMTQVDKLRADGVTGTGVRVAVIDTGVDYHHPALGGCFGEGCLVAFGTDLVGDDYNGFNTPVPDPDPYDGCEGHGTHVSGIIAAQPNPYGFTGAAPDVTLGMYRVFGCGGSAGNDVLIAAYNQAFQDGADIITASIGGASGWSEDPWAVAVQRIVEAGVPCTVSAGNDGSYGLFYASTAANGKKVTAIASVDNTQAPFILLNATYTAGNDSAPEQFGWTQGNPDTWGNVSLPLWAVNYDTTDPANACDPLPDDTPDLSGKIVLVRRGTCTFVQKVTNIAAKGAHYVMFYNNAPGTASVTAVVDGIKGIGMVTAQQGAEWISLLQDGETVTLNIIDPESATQYAEQTPNNATGGFLSTYTSWGPTYELDIKPQVAAPGGLILSTYPLPLGAYAVLSGTSMACPITAAVVALISNVRGTLDPMTIESLLSATANPNVFQDGKTAYPYLAPVAQQGGGLIQAYDAAHATTILSASSLAFNDTAHFRSRKDFTIRNTGSDAVTYAISNIGAASGYTLPADDIYPAPFPNELVASYADIHFSSSKVTVPAGGSKTVSLTLAPPRNLNGDRLAVYSGYIALNASNGEALSLPYQGVVGSMYDATILDPALTYLSRSDSENYDPVAAGTAFTIPADSADATNDTVYPVFAFSLALGSALVRADVIPYVNSSAPGNGHGKGHGGHGYRGRGHHWGHGDHGYGPKTNDDAIGSVVDFPLEYQPRGVQLAQWDGMLADGTLAPAGDYTLSIKALKIFGDSSRLRDYDIVSTVPFTIEYA